MLLLLGVYLTATGRNYTDRDNQGMLYIDEVFPNFNEKGYRPG